MSPLARQLRRYYGVYTAGFLVQLGALYFLERQGMPSRWIGYVFLFFTIFLYAAIGVLSRTADISEYYVAGRQVPAIFNGIATGADWMSAASFIGLAGTLFLAGYQGLAYVLGWTGGFVLVAVLLAPYLRRFGQYTIPDFLSARYGGNSARLVGVAVTILCSFVYVVAQIYGVGLITSRFVGLQFEVGVFVGLAGILVCSFLGGMRAVTWTQVAQYMILIVAYLVPVTLLSYQNTGVPLPQIMYGQVLAEVGEVEKELFARPAEAEARELFSIRAAAFREKIERLPASLQQERDAITRRINELKNRDAQAREIVALERQQRELPSTPELAREYWLAEMTQAEARARAPQPHAQAYPGNSEAERDQARIDFIALVFCLTIGTAALPHVLTRYYTTPTVAQARESVFWSLLFIMLLYLTAPAYAVFAKFEIYTHLIDLELDKLPAWFSAWSRVGLVSSEDINSDGRLQLAELSLNPDVIVLALPEIAGMPYVISGLVAAGGLAAALSTADGLLLTIASALSHDVYYRIIRPDASTQWRLIISKSLLLVVAVLAALVAAQKPGTILYMVAWAFSLAASAFFPALVLGIFWKRANQQGAIAGMLAGVLMCIFYIVRLEVEYNIGGLGLHGLRMEPWFGIRSIAAGVWGVGVGMLVIPVVSLMTSPPSRAIQDFVESVRYPAGPVHTPDLEQRNKRYWRRNCQLTLALLLVWFLATYVASYLAGSLNTIVLFGFPLGFYMAAQGSLIIYVLLVGGYALMMRQMEKKYGIEDQSD
ncbi:MAG: VC_2705 family sodium/solute symporter [Azovibrio sp.]|uniref:VC_2705 family sodium/solute symporter n=1 Tax=Azovibrio sp. TaxID=1872673 RepID=UPI003C721A65